MDGLSGDGASKRVEEVEDDMRIEATVAVARDLVEEEDGGKPVNRRSAIEAREDSIRRGAERSDGFERFGEALSRGRDIFVS